MKLTTPSCVECRGTVKLSGFYSTTEQWKSGRIVLENTSGVYTCSVILDCNKNNKPSATVRLKKTTIKKVVCKGRLIVEFSDGQTFLLNQAKCDRNLRDLIRLLNDIKAGNVDLSSPGKPTMLPNRITSPADKVSSENLGFTRVKEPKSRQHSVSGWDNESFSDLTAADNQQKENLRFFDDFNGYNDYKKKRIKRPQLSSESCKSHSDILFTILSKPFIKSWGPFRDDLEELALCLQDYSDYLTSCNMLQKMRHSLPEPCKKLSEDVTIEHRPVVSSVDACYAKLEEALAQKTDYDPLCFSEGIHLDSPFLNRMQRHRYFEKLHLKQPIDILSAKKSLDFLNRSAEKSRETLKTIGSSSFYSNKSQTPAADRVYGSFSTYSSVKRTPGLLPDPTPTKRSRFSDVQYSWTKNKTFSLSDSKSQGSLQGFSNLGNTCYMNAILQSLFGLEAFPQDLLITNRRLLRTLSKESLYHNLSKLLVARKKVNVSESVRRDLLRNVKTAISSSAKRFSGYQQHDAHEFLGQVLDQLKEEVLKLNKTTPSPCKESSSDDVAVTGQEFINPTIQSFEFEVLHTIQCTECEEKVTKVEQFNDLSLDLPRASNGDDPQTIQDALDLFLQSENLEYTCAECGCKQASVFHSFTRLPRVLIVHLKRYAYSITANQNTKMGRSVFVPRYLTLQSFCSEETLPPYPIVVPAVTPSPQVGPLDSSREEGRSEVTRRKLDYTANRFSGSFRRVRAAPTNDSDEESWTSLEKKPRRDSSGDIEVPREEDWEPPQVLGLSGMEEREQAGEETAVVKTEQGCEKSPAADGSATLTEEQQLQKALELSRFEAKQNSTMDMSDLRLENMTEEEMVRLAMERSIMESTNPKKAHSSQKEEPTNQKTPLKTCDSNQSESNKDRSAETLDSPRNDWATEQSVAKKDPIFKNSNEVTSRSRRNSLGSPAATKRQISSPISHTVAKGFMKDNSFASTDLESLALSPICRNGYSRPSLKGGAMKWDQTVGKELQNDSAVFSEDDEVILLKEEKIDISVTKQTTPKATEQVKAESLDEVDGGYLPNHGKPLPTQEDEFLMCPERDEDLEDKENKTPPHSASNGRKDSDWRTPGDKGNKEIQDVLTFDLDEEDEDIRKAKELSLRELEQQAGYSQPEDDSPSAEPLKIARTTEETESLKKHFEDGHLPYPYRLVSVVSHIGSTSATGHYVSDVYDFKKGEWNSYNDSHVTKTTEEEVRSRRQRSGYIFFYMCRNVHEDIRLQAKLQAAQKETSSR